jgi:two-component system, sensor histidine kinase and response regulator
MRQNAAGQIIFVIDALDGPASVGEVYQEPGWMLAANFARMDQPMMEQDFYTDAWGTWLSGYAPFYRVERLDSIKNKVG